MTAVRRVLLYVVVVVLSSLAVACGSDDGEDTGGAPPASSPSGRALTVEEALAGEAGSEVTVTGTLFISDATGIRLCGAILESYPPQCGEPSLVVEGLDVGTVDGLQSTDDGAVSWAEGLELTGVVEDGDVLRVQE